MGLETKISDRHHDRRYDKSAQDKNVDQMIGVDIVETERIKKAIETTPDFTKKIFTDKEIKYCESRNAKYQSFAARFAAKEAFMKALGTGWEHGISFRDIEIQNKENGKPYITIHGKAKEIFTTQGFKHTHISLSHTDTTAIATVMFA